ncbi:MAG: acyltransferase 3 [Bacteroidetes bacterium]|jgi:peptidoglycan/LPS O-acetylase OafA/YrhL|nr:acyltransferase 3 [Bacteroidota bacterium]
MQRIHFIDGLRGILALIVFFHHFILMFFPAYYYGCSNIAEGFSTAGSIYKTIAYTPLNLLINGNFAVVFFFVLSGYVLSIKYLRNFSSQLLSQDVFKRYFRLSIPILASCLMVYLAHRFSLLHNRFVPVSQMNESWLPNLFKQDYPLWRVITFSFLDAIFLGKTPYNSVLWTMVFEFFGALVVFLLLFINQFNKRPVAVVSFFAILGFCVGGIYILPFCLGLIIAYIQQKNIQFNSSMIRRAILLVLSIAGFYLASYPSAPYEILARHMHRWILIKDFPGMVLYEAMGCALLFFVLLNSKSIQRFLSVKPLLFIGKLSFSVYLTHLLVLCTFSSWLFEKLYLTHTFTQSAQIVFGCTFFVLLIVAYVFYKAVEQPTPRLAKFIAGNWFGFEKENKKL